MELTTRKNDRFNNSIRVNIITYPLNIYPIRFKSYSVKLAFYEMIEFFTQQFYEIANQKVTGQKVTVVKKIPFLSFWLRL